MLKEIRNIIFTQNEIEEAVKLFHGTVQAILPAGRIISFETAGNNEPTLKVNVVAPKEGEVSSVTIVPAHVAAAMLHFCIKNGIPVPRKAKKKIGLIDGNLALTLTL
ncbi:MAG: hypothetical protein V4628_12130 [Pseudomonadota bacterium]